MVSEVKLVVLIILYLVFLMSGLYDKTQHSVSIYTAIWIISLIGILLLNSFESWVLFYNLNS